MARPHKESMATAFCVSGQTRSFTAPIVFKSIKHNVFDAFGTPYDVFVHVALATRKQTNTHGLEHLSTDTCFVEHLFR